ncbi:MAG: type II toxin-antitoxin system prevent-host-death family antitoxin [Treponema sp.]|nr:type II toxin-antitoxin system prevent-host-death family antitoxin [Treponema sp.]
MALSMIQISNNYYDVGSFDAKTYFAELLRNIAEGKTIRITKNGKPVAVMQSPQKVINTEAVEAVKKLRTISNEIAEKAQNSGSGKITIDEIIQLKEEGRKY